MVDKALICAEKNEAELGLGRCVGRHGRRRQVLGAKCLGAVAVGYILQFTEAGNATRGRGEGDGNRLHPRTHQMTERESKYLDVVWN